jgi:beta-alanine degradation protein BauB
MQHYAILQIALAIVLLPQATHEVYRLHVARKSPPNGVQNMQFKPAFLTAFITAHFVISAAFAADPVQTDGDKYVVKFENDRIRVLEYNDVPGDKTHEHHHPAFVLYAMSPFKRKITLPGGKVIMREFKAGDVLASEAQTHIGENVGKTSTHVLMIEMKQ